VLEEQIEIGVAGLDLVGRGGEGDVDAEGAREILRELKAVGGDLHALRLALTGADRGPELAAVLAALSREEAIARADRARGAA